VDSTSFISGISTGNLTVYGSSASAFFQGTVVMQGNLNVSTPRTSMWLAGGGKKTTVNDIIQYSYDGINWSNITGGIPDAGCTGLAYNGTIWVAAFSGLTNLVYSRDGLTWATGSNLFTGNGFGVAWNGRYWLAGGNSSGGGNTIKYSYDGINWSNAANSMTNQTVSFAWNGSYWLATGTDSAASNCIMKSFDGINWTASMFTNTFPQGYKIVWNGQLWVACGAEYSSNTSLKYSYNGSNWSNSTGFGFNGNQTTSVAWNGRMWVAVGIDGRSNSTISYSYNGISWNAATSGLFYTDFTPAGAGKSVEWNGNYWVAVGYDANSNNYIKYSYDGLNWSNSLAIAERKNIVGYSSNTQGSLLCDDLLISGTNNPLFLKSTNSIQIGYSSILTLNNTVYVDGTNNRVGINTTAPTVTLDINGTIAKTAGSFDIVHPDPEKAAKHMRLRHCFVESPTRGDNIYRWLFSTVNNTYTYELPSYFKYLNEMPTTHVSPVDSFGRGYATINQDLTHITLHTSENGLYNVMAIATRKDIDAVNYFDKTGGVEYIQYPN
jgi:hypothetical protein